MGSLKDAELFQPATDVLVRHGAHVEVLKGAKAAESERGLLTRLRDWVSGDRNDCNILACLTEALRGPTLAVHEDFKIFYTLRDEFKKRKNKYFDRVGLEHVLDLVLGRGNIERAFEVFSAVGHEKLSELLYGGAAAQECVEDELLDRQYNILHGTYCSNASQVEQCEEFEFTLKSRYEFSDLAVVKQYVKLANAGFPVAAWRLYQVYQQGLFNQPADPVEAEKYSLQAIEGGLVPQKAAVLAEKEIGSARANSRL